MSELTVGAAVAEVIGDEVVELVELVDLSIHGRDGTKPPKAKAYRLVIDGVEKTVNVHEMTGREILALVDKTPDRWVLTEVLHRKRRERIQPDQVVVFHHHGVVRFETCPKTVRNGDAGSRSCLTAEDVDFLNSLGLAWSELRDGANAAIVVRGFRLPAGYDRQEVDLMVRVPEHYDAGGLDMFNLSVPLSRADGRAIAKVTETTFAGIRWWQWSRHRELDQPWVSGLDSLATHFALIEAALAADAA